MSQATYVPHRGGGAGGAEPAPGQRPPRRRAPHPGQPAHQRPVPLPDRPPTPGRPGRPSRQPHPPGTRPPRPRPLHRLHPHVRQPPRLLRPVQRRPLGAHGPPRDRDCDDDTATRIDLVDNRAAEKRDWDLDGLVELLSYLPGPDRTLRRDRVRRPYRPAHQPRGQPHLRPQHLQLRRPGRAPRHPRRRRRHRLQRPGRPGHTALVSLPEKDEPVRGAPERSAKPGDEDGDLDTNPEVFNPVINLRVLHAVFDRWRSVLDAHPGQPPPPRGGT